MQSRMSTSFAFFLRSLLLLAALFWTMSAGSLAFQSARSLSSAFDGPWWFLPTTAVAFVSAVILCCGTVVATARPGAVAWTRWLWAAPMAGLALMQLVAADFGHTGSRVWLAAAVAALILLPFLPRQGRSTLTGRPAREPEELVASRAV